MQSEKQKVKPIVTKLVRRKEGEKSGLRPLTEESINEMEEQHYRFHVDTLHTDPEIARKIASGTVRHLREELATEQTESSNS